MCMPPKVNSDPGWLELYFALIFSFYSSVLSNVLIFVIEKDIILGFLKRFIYKLCGQVWLPGLTSPLFLTKRTVFLPADSVHVHDKSWLTDGDRRHVSSPSTLPLISCPLSFTPLLLLDTTSVLSPRLLRRWVNSLLQASVCGLCCSDHSPTWWLEPCPQIPAHWRQFQCFSLPGLAIGTPNTPSVWPSLLTSRCDLQDIGLLLQLSNWPLPLALSLPPPTTALWPKSSL